MTVDEFYLLFQVLTISVSLIFWGLVYPLIIILEILKKKNVFWLILVCLLGPLTAPIWALFYGSKAWKKWAGLLGYVMMVIATLWFVNLTDKIISQMKLAPDAVLSSLQFQDNVSEHLKTQIQQDVFALKEELEKYGYRDFINLSLDYRLIVLLLKMNENGLTSDETQRWISLFENRKNLDPYNFNPDTEL